MMLNGQAAFRMDAVLLAVLFIGVTGYLTNSVLALIAGRLLRWRNLR